MQAANAAGLQRLTLLEEPQAAFSPGWKRRAPLARRDRRRRDHSGLRRGRRHHRL
ncbi:MAG: hypothetical protein R2911_42780 [Caldilineaceae bacterium]